MSKLRAALTRAPRAVTGFTGGAFVPAQGEALPVLDPGTGAVIAHLYESDAAEWTGPSWGRGGPSRRARGGTGVWNSGSVY